MKIRRMAHGAQARAFSRFSFRIRAVIIVRFTALEIVDEQPPVQMVHLVLHADRPALAELRLVHRPVQPQSSAAAPAPAGSRPRRPRGSTGTPPRWSPAPPSAQSISGLMHTIGSGGSSLPAQSITKTCFITPSCVAASPIPGASYIVASMSAASARSSSSTASTGPRPCAAAGRDGSGWVGSPWPRDRRSRRALTRRPAGLAPARSAPRRLPVPPGTPHVRLRRDHRPPRHPLLEMGHDAAALRRPPDDGLAMWVADMDFRPPPAVTAALAAEAAHGVFGYFGDDRAYKAAVTRLDGPPPRLGGRSRPRSSPPTASSPASRICLQAFTAPGDGVILFTPVYHAFYRVIRANGREIVRVAARPATTAATPWTSRRWPPRSPAASACVVLCSPHNPGGRVWDATSCARSPTSAATTTSCWSPTRSTTTSSSPAARHVPMPLAAPEVARPAGDADRHHQDLQHRRRPDRQRHHPRRGAARASPPRISPPAPRPTASAC